MTSPSRAILPVASALAVLALRAEAALAAAGEQTPLELGGEAPTRAAQGAGDGGTVVRTLLGLLVVVAAIYGVYWILGQVKASREERASGSGLDSLASLPLGPGRSLHLIRSGREVVLIGVGEHGVTPIRTYSEPEAVGVLGLVEEELTPLPLEPRPARPARVGLPAPGVLHELRKRTVRR